MSNCNEVIEQHLSLLVIGSDQSAENVLRTMLKEQPVSLTFVDSVYEAKQCILQDVSSFV